MVKWRIQLILLLTIFIIAACNEGNVDTDKTSIQEEANEVKHLIDEYNGNFESEDSASVTGTELIITDKDGKANSYPLPEEEFFVSIAPFKEFTHPCTNHSLTGCQGELSEETFQVYVTDNAGNVVIENILTSGKNGFIDLWLPRNKQYNIKITKDGETATEEISTYDDSPTCITTMQLI